MNRFIKTLCLLSAVTLMACKNAPNSEVLNGDDKSLTQQLEGIKSKNVIDINNLQGNTDTEKLLHLLDIPTALRSVTLVILDTQISSFEAVGNKTEAKALKKNRELLTQALDEAMGEYVEATAKVYEEYFTKAEIKELIVIYSQPIMQKQIASNVDIQQKLIPVSETWSKEHVLPIYNRLLKEAKK